MKRHLILLVAEVNWLFQPIDFKRQMGGFYLTLNVTKRRTVE
jgi:hypothetical protein